MMNKKSIFVSRSLSTDSLILKVAEGHHLVDKSLISLAPLDFEQPECNWLFFYSRNGVKFFIEKENDLSSYKIAAIGTGTAETLEEYGQKIDFIGHGDSDQIVSQFEKVLPADDRVCFIRALNSKNSILSRMSSKHHFDLVAYENKKSTTVPQEQFDILIFTSSMNVDAYFDQCNYLNQPCIAIGKPTTETLKKYNISKIICANHPSEAAIAKELMSLLQK